MTTKPIRVPREFQEFIERTRLNLARSLKVPPNAISKPVATQKVMEWAILGKELEKKLKMKMKRQNSDWVEKVNNQLEIFLNNITE